MKDVFLPVLKTTELFIILYILDGVSCRRFLFTIALRSFEKKIYSKRLKLPVAVHSSSVEILICQLRGGMGDGFRPPPPPLRAKVFRNLAMPLFTVCKFRLA